MVYTNLKDSPQTLHGLFESSRLTATDTGRIYDALVVKDMTDKEAIDVDNGVAVKIHDFTGDGLQEVYATVATTKDKIAVVGAPADVKSAMTTAQAQPYNFYIPAGTSAKTWQVRAEDDDIFGVALYQFTTASVANVKKDAYVVVDGNGMWVAQAAAPDATKYGFIGKVHSVSQGSYYTIIRILAVQNKDIA